MSEKSSSGASGGIGFCGALTIAFIVLKLCGVINWSWLWVLSPLWLPVAIIIVGFLYMFIMCLLCVIIMNVVDKTIHKLSKWYNKQGK